MDFTKANIEGANGISSLSFIVVDIPMTVSCDPPVDHKNAWMVRILYTRAEIHQRLSIRKSMNEWCHENIENEWWYVKTKYRYFSSQTDALLFYLRYH